MSSNTYFNNILVNYNNILIIFGEKTTKKDKVFGRGGGAELFTCLYPLKVQARPPQDQRLTTQSSVSGRTSFFC